MKQPFSDHELAELRRNVERLSGMAPYLWRTLTFYEAERMQKLFIAAPRLLEAAEEASRSPSTTVVVDLLGRLDKAKAMIDEILGKFQQTDGILGHYLCSACAAHVTINKWRAQREGLDR
jgi:hypothetical protein